MAWPGKVALTDKSIYFEEEEDENPYTIMVPRVNSDLLPFVIKLRQVL